MTSCCWYIAKTNPRKERLVVYNLARWGVETFFPYIRKPVSASPLTPLFASYVFCRFDISDPSWQAIRWTPGLAYFLGADGQPSAVPDSLVEYLVDRTRQWNQGGFRREFATGDSVMITSGPFTGLDAIFQTYLSSRERCRVLLRTVSNTVTVDLPGDDLDEPGGGWRRRLALSGA